MSEMLTDRAPKFKVEHSSSGSLGKTTPCADSVYPTQAPHAENSNTADSVMTQLDPCASPTPFRLLSELRSKCSLLCP